MKWRPSERLALLVTGIVFVIAGIRGASFSATLEELREGKLPPPKPFG